MICAKNSQGQYSLPKVTPLPTLSQKSAKPRQRPPQIPSGQGHQAEGRLHLLCPTSQQFSLPHAGWEPSPEHRDTGYSALASRAAQSAQRHGWTSPPPPQATEPMGTLLTPPGRASAPRSGQRDSRRSMQGPGAGQTAAAAEACSSSLVQWEQPLPETTEH